MRKVLVMLSTYNGESYLDEQISSLQTQNGVETFILIRDDLSSDKTVEIAKKAEKDNDHIYVVQGEKNIGPALSFMEMVSIAGYDYDFYAFCDQDDVWLSDKLDIATSILTNNEEEPSLYFSQTNLVDSNLNSIGYGDMPERNLSLKQLMFFPVASGCTMVFNKKTLQLLKSHMPSCKIMHDYWTHLIVLACGGNVYMDHNSYILYRQHDKNTIGSRKVHMANVLGAAIIRNTLDSKVDVARELYQNYQEYINDDDCAFLQRLIHYKKIINKINLIFDREIYIPIGKSKEYKKKRITSNISTALKLLFSHL